MRNFLFVLVAAVFVVGQTPTASQSRTSPETATQSRTSPETATQSRTSPETATQSRTSPETATKSRSRSLSDIAVTCADPCLTCSRNNATLCLSCPANFFLSASTCLPCGQNCVNCNNAEVCTSCQNGFFLNQTSQCQRCAATCTTCEAAATTCTQCADGLRANLIPGPCSNFSCLSTQTHYLSGLCIPCESPCSSCADNFPSTCTSCLGATYLSGSSCPACKTGCSSCENATTCETCQSGYFFIDSDCQKCNSPCGNCDGAANNCTSCESPRFLLNSNACNLKSCPNNTFLNQTGGCAECHKNCEGCTGPTQKDCIVCKHGNGDDGTCDQRHSVLRRKPGAVFGIVAACVIFVGVCGAAFGLNKRRKSAVTPL